METKLIRLISGEEIIAKTEPTDGGITIQDAVILIPTKAGSLGLTNWMPYVEVSEILNSSIVFVGIPHADLVKQYDSVISGIVVPDNEIKTPADLKLTT